MNSFKQYRSVCIAVAVFIGMLGLLVPHASYGADKDVNVVNTPTVDANQMGDWDVTVDNDGTNPVPVQDVDHPARQRLAKTPVTLISFDATQASNNQSVIVPANKILVIEHVSLRSPADFTVPADAALRISLNVITTGLSHFHSFAPAGKHNRFGAPGVFFSQSQPVRIYADPGTTVILVTDRNFLNNTNMFDQSVSVTISGHFVDP